MYKKILFFKYALAALVALCFFYAPANYAAAKHHKKPVDQLRGFYLGLQAGYASAGYKTSSLQNVTPTDVSTTGFAVGPFVGYFVDHYYGVELGVLYLNKPTFNGLPAGFDRDKIKSNVVYFVNRIRVPITKNFSGFARLGIGYVVRDGISYPTFTALPEGELMTIVYGVGLDARVYKNLHVIGSWLMTMHRDSVQLPSAQFIGLGGYYFFGI